MGKTNFIATRCRSIQMGQNPDMAGLICDVGFTPKGTSETALRTFVDAAPAGSPRWLPSVAPPFCDQTFCSAWLLGNSRAVACLLNSILARLSKRVSDVSAHMPGVVVALIGSLAVSACTYYGASLGDAVPLPANSVPLPRPAPKSSAARQSTAPQDVAIWRHLPEPVSIQQFNQDKAKCTRMGNSAPGSGSPEMKFYLVFSNCMRSEGYEAG